MSTRFISVSVFLENIHLYASYYVVRCVQTYRILALIIGSSPVEHAIFGAQSSHNTINSLTPNATHGKKEAIPTHCVE
jgi:hypothetical protein